MSSEDTKTYCNQASIALKGITGAIILVLACSFNIFSETIRDNGQNEEITAINLDSIAVTSSIDTIDSITPIALNLPQDSSDDTGKKTRIFSPDPIRAVWMSALIPGLGQLYNRRYWKLPIVIGGYMGLAYATSWNNGMLRDYTRAYADIMDNDPNTKSYMDFFPSTTTEESLDKTWLTNVLQSRKNYYRRNRDLCIICMVGVYLLAMVDAYVDASLAHFDISPDLSMDLAPTLIPDERSSLPGVGIQWAFNF